jgi:hypothetical protein
MSKNQKVMKEATKGELVFRSWRAFSVTRDALPAEESLLDCQSKRDSSLLLPAGRRPRNDRKRAFPSRYSIDGLLDAQ